MKKTDTFYLSDKQLEQLKNFENKKSPTRLIIVALLFIISCASGILLNYTQNETLQMILTGITGFGGLGCVIVCIASPCDNSPAISDSEKKELSTEEIGKRSFL